MRALAAAVSALAVSLVAAQTGPLEIAKDAPDKYVVVKGDTLWDISGRFLQQPWRWPELWQMNREQIRNPHWIYPGDIVYMDSSGGTPRLRLARAVDGERRGAGDSAGAGESTERVQPAVRTAPMPAAAIPTIDARVIEPFLSRPVVAAQAELMAHPRIVATQDGRVYLGRGDLAFVRGLKDDSVKEWHVYRSARPLLDPATRQPIAWEATSVGLVRLEKFGDPSSVRVVSASEEMGLGDRLMPIERARPSSYVPRPPESPVAGRIVSVYRGVSQAGRDSVVALNVGASSGVEVGNVLQISEQGRVVRDRDTRENIVLPGQAVGHLLVFRVFDKIAYGLIMRSSRDIAVGDTVANP